MKKIISLVLISIVLCGVFCSCGKSKEVYALGDTVETGEISFTLNKFAFAEHVDEDTFDPFEISDSGMGPLEGYIYAYFNYTIANNSKETVKHSYNFDIKVVYGEDFEYGEDYDYRETPIATTDSHQIVPLTQKTYNRIIDNCPETVVENKKDIKIVVTIKESDFKSKEFTYLIPASELVVTEGVWAK